MKVAVYFILLLFLGCSASFDQQLKELEKNNMPVEKLDEQVYRIGNVLLDHKRGEIKIEGWVNMQQGLVELVACGLRGKKHESILVLDVIPRHLQVALLLAGLEPGGNLAVQGDPRTPKGDRVTIWVEWKTAAGNRRMRAENLVYNVATQRPMRETQWVFSGSKIIDGAFMADLEESLITTFHDPHTIIDNPLETGGDDTLYVANERVLPPVGTSVQVIIGY